MARRRDIFLSRLFSRLHQGAFHPRPRFVRDRDPAQLSRGQPGSQQSWGQCGPAGGRSAEPGCAQGHMPLSLAEVSDDREVEQVSVTLPTPLGFHCPGLAGALQSAGPQPPFPVPPPQPRRFGSDTPGLTVSRVAEAACGRPGHSPALSAARAEPHGVLAARAVPGEGGARLPLAGWHRPARHRILRVCRSGAPCLLPRWLVVDSPLGRETRPATGLLAATHLAEGSAEGPRPPGGGGDGRVGRVPPALTRSPLPSSQRGEVTPARL